MGVLEDRLAAQEKVFDDIAAQLQPLADDIRILMDFKNDAMNSAAPGQLTPEQTEAFDKLDKKGADILARLRFMDGLNPNTPATPVPEPTPAPEPAPAEPTPAPAASTDPQANGTGDLSEQQKAEIAAGTTGVQPPGATTAEQP